MGNENPRLSVVLPDVYQLGALWVMATYIIVLLI